MKKLLFSALCFAAGFSAWGQTAAESFAPLQTADRSLYFNISDPGKKLPIVWGLDTAWPSEENIVRGVRNIGADKVTVARVSFQPFDFLLYSTELTSRLEDNLKERLRLVSLINPPGKVKLVLNNDGPLEEVDERYLNPAKNAQALTAYCNLIYATMLSCQDKGWEVITASPLNEPDYTYNGQGSMQDFLAIAAGLKLRYPEFRNGEVRISGGNTLNCDCALPWYEYLYNYIDEGNTHQLAGEFDQYADFFARVRADGKYATADELHNIMEAMVGVEYGMQTGIWWGTAEYSRGQFCQASFGERLAYAENRNAWTSAAVYRAPGEKYQAFVGSSERQAKPSSYRFVSRERDVFFDGYGPTREYVVRTPGGDGYQLPEQTNAEAVVDITWGEDVAPVVNGTYIVMNKKTNRLLGVSGFDNANEAVTAAKGNMEAVSWNVSPVPITVGGDFAYHQMQLASKPEMKLDILNWSLNDNGAIIIYNGGLGNNEQWHLQYAGDGWFRIVSRHSCLCLVPSDNSGAEGVKVVQRSPADNDDAQLWRFLPTDAALEQTAPDAPTALKATRQSASVLLEWTASKAADVAYYNIYRAEAGSNEFTTVGRYVKGTRFVDNTAATGVSYNYKVKAADLSMNLSPATATVAASTLSEKAMVAHLTFDGALTDDSPNRFDAATSEGGRVMYTSGMQNGTKALSLSLNRYVQLPYRVADSRELTLACWLNLTAQSDEQTLFDFGCGPDCHLALTLNSSGALRLTAANSGAEKTAEGGFVTTGTWQHVAATLSPDRLAIYLDGKLVAEAANSSATSPQAIAPIFCYVGRDQETTSTYLRAAVADLRAYNYALSAGEISDVMKDATGGLESVTTDATVVATEYYTPTGILIPATTGTPAPGTYIVRRIYSDGTTSTTKQHLR